VAFQDGKEVKLARWQVDEIAGESEVEATKLEPVYGAVVITTGAATPPPSSPRMRSIPPAVLIARRVVDRRSGPWLEALAIER
jgi:hypothetical protein